MPNRSTLLPITTSQDQLRSVNEKIAKLASVTPYDDLYSTFAFAAQLATEAIAATRDLQQMPGIDARDFEQALNFWHRTQANNRMAALDCAGGNRSLAEALITFRLFRSIRK